MPQPAALTRTDEPSIHDVIEPPARFHATANLFLLRAQTQLRGVSHPKLASGIHQSSFDKASDDIQHSLRERRMVEPDGIEPTT